MLIEKNNSGGSNFFHSTEVQLYHSLPRTENVYSSNAYVLSYPLVLSSPHPAGRAGLTAHTLQTRPHTSKRWSGLWAGHFTLLKRVASHHSLEAGAHSMDPGHTWGQSCTSFQTSLLHHLTSAILARPPTDTWVDVGSSPPTSSCADVKAGRPKASEVGLCISFLLQL